MTLTISDSTVIPYPEEELKDLKKIIKFNGVLKAIQDNTGIAPSTTKTIAQDKCGQKAKVDKLKDFVKAFNNQFK